MIRDRTFGLLEYQHGEWNRRAPLRVVAESYERAVEVVCGRGLTLVASPRIVSLHHLVAKVWDGNGFRYCYQFPRTAP